MDTNGKVASVIDDPAIDGAVDATRCPICGESNLCAVEAARQSGNAQVTCWCMQADFSAALLARVPEATRGISCICARCAVLKPD